MSTICVLSGHYPASDYLSAENHRIYCSYHGYHYIHCNWPTPAKITFLNKIYFLQHYIGLFDYIFWLDDDAFFLDMEKSLDDFIPANGNIISICRSPSNKILKTLFSSGSFMLDCKKGENFIDAVINTDLLQVKSWWKPEFGFFTGGDQDIMVYLYLTDPEFQHKFQLFDHMEFNSRVEDMEAGNKIFLIHITGTNSIKKKIYRKLQDKLNTDRSLINENSKNGYKVIDPSKLIYKLKMCYFRIMNLVRLK